MPDLTRAEVEQIKAMLPTLLHPAISLSSAAKFEALCSSWLTLEAELQRWRNWHPDDETMAMYKEQAEQADFRLKAPVKLYINALEARVRELEGALDELHARRQELIAMCAQLQTELIALRGGQED